uniref:Uncharacterized protein n=1 Tax=Panagrolaimus davidi TaxID=227884 RepID=A0A914QKE0_9BILA
MGLSLICKRCGCSWSTHLHITFTQEEFEKNVIDEDIAQTVKTYKETQANIDRILAKFASFLKKNAILAYNDTIEDYLKLNIRNEQQQLLPNTGLIETMNAQLQQYQEQKRILDKRLEKGEEQEIQPNEIILLQKDLENLPLVGETFKTLFYATVNGKEINHAYSEQYFDPSNHGPQKQRKKSGGGGKSWIKALKF